MVPRVHRHQSTQTRSRPNTMFDTGVLTTMRPFFSLTTLLFLASCGTKDDTGSPPEDDNACASSFVLTQSDGTELAFDDCQLQATEVNFAVAPDAIIPQVHRLSYIFRTSEDVGTECWILWELSGICSERDTHNFGTEGSTLGWNTLGCDMPDTMRGAFEATDGGSVFTTRNVAPVAGLLEGDLMEVEIEAQIDGSDASGARLVGTVSISETLPLVTIPYEGCEGANGDQDRDGSEAVEFGGTDCDDADPQIGPHAEEVCDGVDNNCDGQVDEGKLLTFYQDTDGDGFGDADNSVEACEAPEGTAEFAGDCDDNDDSINPDATETCDGIDNDCDGAIDDGDAQVAVYLDTDGDGFGDDSTITLSCPDDIPENYTMNGNDCDESDASINPAASETCGDGIDNNCNEEVDEDCP